jgi:hypothetical protein
LVVSQIRVVTDASRLVDQKVGLYCLGQDVAAALHSWSHGVSGQWLSSCVAQSDRQRSPGVKVTCEDGSIERRGGVQDRPGGRRL